MGFSTVAEIAPPGMRIAIVDGDETNRRHLEFGAHAAQKDGDVAIFSDVAEAQQWLVGAASGDSSNAEAAG